MTLARKSLPERGFLALLADAVDRGAEEVDVGDTGNLDRVLEGEEDAGDRAFGGVEFEEVNPIKRDAAFRDFVFFAAG